MDIRDLKAAGDHANNFGCKCVIYGPAGGGKCLAKGTSVLMFDGSIKAVEDIKIGELLMGPDSTPRTVMSLAHGYENMFDVIPIKGNSYRVNQSHILSIYFSDRKYIANITIDQFLSSSENFKKNAKTWRTGVEFQAKPVYLNPYLLGLWLGDGSSDEPAFHTIDTPIVDFLNQIAKAYSVTVKEYKNKDKCPRYRLTVTGGKGKSNGLRDSFNYYGLFNNKHIPDDFKHNSKEIRLNVLAGLLDTDGHLNNNCYTISSKLQRLADDICYLARSVGLAAYKKEQIKECVNNGVWGTYWQVSISGETSIIPCQLKRKQATKRTQIKDALVSGITVKFAEYGEYFGFELAGKDKLFLLGDFTVTHNTPVINTAIRPLLLSIEPGLLSMRGSTVPTFEAHTSQRIDEFFKWFFNSTETKNFDTLAIDSGSYMADVYLQAALKGTSSAGNKKHGMQAYGEMASNTIEHLRTLFYVKQKHVYLICKEELADVEYQSLRRPYFPGKVLNIDVPFLYDFILRLAKTNIPGQGEHLAFQCIGNMNILARNRTGNLNEFEPPHFGNLCQKAMTNPPLINY